MLKKIVLLLLLSVVAIPVHAAPKPAVADKYLDLTTTYCIYAKTLWHESDPGGYWGDGLAPAPDKNGNGNVRGMSSTMLGYAMLIHAQDEGWLDPKLAGQLQQAELTRPELLRYIEQNLKFLSAHHLSNTQGPDPKWGFSWQSTLWLGSSGPAVLLVWKDLPHDIKTDYKRVAGSEADRIIAKPPKNYKPGDTGAEENAWDEYAPAVALAIDPTNPHAADWMKALKSYAMNVYSIRADQGQDLVTTANLFDDFTLENHGFFHPDYVQVSGQDLGTSLAVLQMGDKLNGTHLAEEFKPCAMHHLKDVWENVMQHLLLDDGQFAFPNGTDWTIHTTMEPGYLACIATLLKDPIAITAESRDAGNALRRREVSPAGRIFGDTNMEWWWEPLLIQRFASAMIQHENRDSESTESASTEPPTGATLLPVAKVFIYRNADYFASLAWGERHMGTFYPASQTDSITLPIDGILPKEIDAIVEHKSIDDAYVATMKDKSGKLIYCICFPHSVLWLSESTLRPLGIENDKFSGGKRRIFGKSDDKDQPMLGNGKFTVAGNWVNIDDKLGLISMTDGFAYTAPKDFNRKSAAFDTIAPNAKWGTWQMIAHATHDQTKDAASKFKAEVDGQHAKVQLLDDKQQYTIEADFGSNSITVKKD
jgi:hypothetical protein